MKKWIAIAMMLGWAAIPTRAADTKVDFTKEILPVLRENCFKCHGAEKQKGKLRLDSKEAALKGGKGGPAYVAGDAAKSDLVRRVLLPKSDDDFMPSEGEPLTKAQIELMREWINQGALWPETAIVSAPKPAASPGPALPADFKPSAAEQKAVAALAQKGIDLRPIAANSNWREGNLRLLGTGVTDSVIAQLKDVASLVDLNLANTKVTDAGLAHLKNLTNLTRLHLELTAVTDAGLAHLKPLQNLNYLNLYGTKVSDAGLDQLTGLKQLRSLYVWQSKVSESGVKKLKAALPNLEVSTGWDVTALAKKAEKKDEKATAEKKDDKAAEKKPADKKDEKPAKTDEKKEDKKDEKKQ